MGNISKAFSLFIIVILAVSSLIIVKPAFAQSTPKPSVPEFTIKSTEHSYDVPPIYGIDQFTGQNITIQEGAHYQWETLDFTIRNQQVISGYSLYYNIQYKGQFTINWTELYHAGTYIQQQSGQYSTIPFLLSGSLPPSQGDIYRLVIPAGPTVDFQVEALEGETSRGSTQFASGDIFNGEPSGWSNTQTITISDNSTANSGTSPSSSPNSTTTPQQPDAQKGVLFGISWEQVALILLGITVIVLAFALLFSRKRSIKQSVSSQVHLNS
jgi:hypothetical protein